MPLIAVRNSGASALFTTTVTGADLSRDDALDLKSELDQAKALIEAIEAAMSAARDQGVASFAPTSEGLTLPQGMTPAVRDALFAQRMDRSFSGSALSLTEWSQAVAQLEAYVGAAQSQLPPDLGGGIVNMKGLWYVNGQAFTLAEVYLANRVNTYAEMDRLLTQSLNTIAANNEVVHTFTKGLKHISEKMQTWVGSGGAYSATSSPTQSAAYLIGDSVVKSGDSWQADWLKFVKWSKDTYGTDGQGNRFSSTAAALSDFNFQVSRSDAIKLRDEMQAYMDSKSADNQVAQMRTESIFTTRANLLEGMGAFMKGQQNAASSVARNTA